jgi:three-Cys-motif partner protein
MKQPEHYRGREQTYLKHFFLEHYLERVAYNIGSFTEQFVYVDGFSGPWQSADEDLEDTSFKIATRILNRVQGALRERGRKFQVRCLFIENNEAAFVQLERAISVIHSVEVKALNGEFEQTIPNILEFIGDAFSLVFIDPTGWTGFDPEIIAPLLKHTPGEVLINFMYDHIRRFLESPSSKVSASIKALLGPTHDDVPRTEEAVASRFCERVRTVGNFKCVTWTPILKPTADRTYFHLVYGTRNSKGLVEFRGVEAEKDLAQANTRSRAKKAKREQRSGMLEFELSDRDPFSEMRKANVEKAVELLERSLASSNKVSYDELRGKILEIPFVDENRLLEMLQDLQAQGRLSVDPPLKPRERKFKIGHSFALVAG